MEESINPFRKAGIALLVIGLIDICAVIISFYAHYSYSSEFNVFAVLAGAMLIKGGVRTARVVCWFSTYFVFSYLIVIFLYPLVVPIGLIIAEIKLDPMGSLGSFIDVVLFMGILIWVYLQLSSSKSVMVLSEAGLKTGFQKSAVYTALVTMVVVGGILGVIRSGEHFEKARDLVSQKMGSEYEYHVGNITFNGDKGSVLVYAYNESTIKTMRVEW